MERIGEADMTLIVKRAEAEKKAMELLSDAINTGGGKDIMKIKLAQQYMGSMQNIYNNTDCIIAPKEATNIAAILTMLQNQKTV